MWSSYIFSTANHTIMISLQNAYKTKPISTPSFGMKKSVFMLIFIYFFYDRPLLGWNRPCELEINCVGSDDQLKWNVFIIFVLCIVQRPNDESIMPSSLSKFFIESWYMWLVHCTYIPGIGYCTVPQVLVPDTVQYRQVQVRTSTCMYGRCPTLSSWK